MDANDKARQEASQEPPAAQGGDGPRILPFCAGDFQRKRLRHAGDLSWPHARHWIRDGDVLLYRGDLPHSRLIRRHTESVYSHAGIFAWSGSGACRGLWVIESLEPKGIIETPFERYLAGSGLVDWYAIDDPAVDRCGVVRYCRERVGHRYPLAQLFWSFGWVASWLRRALHLPIDLYADRQYCFELVAAAFYAHGFRPDGPENKPSALVSGADIATWTCLTRQGTIYP